MEPLIVLAQNIFSISTNQNQVPVWTLYITIIHYLCWWTFIILYSPVHRTHNLHLQIIRSDKYFLSRLYRKFNFQLYDLFLDKVTIFCPAGGKDYSYGSEGGKFYFPPSTHDKMNKYRKMINIKYVRPITFYNLRLYVFFVFNVHALAFVYINFIVFVSSISSRINRKLVEVKIKVNY